MNDAATATTEKEHVCSKCGTKLIEKETWYPSHKKRKRYICKKCANKVRGKYTKPAKARQAPPAQASEAGTVAPAPAPAIVEPAISMLVVPPEFYELLELIIGQNDDFVVRMDAIVKALRETAFANVKALDLQKRIFDIQMAAATGNVPGVDEEEEEGEEDGEMDLGPAFAEFDGDDGEGEAEEEGEGEGEGTESFEEVDTAEIGGFGGRLRESIDASHGEGLSDEDKDIDALTAEAQAPSEPEQAEE